MSHDAPRTGVLVADSLTTDAAPLSGADGAGPEVDSVLLPRARNAFVRAVGVIGDGADTGTMFLVDDSGTAYGIADDDTAKRLGFEGAPTRAPWPVLARLPRGPALSVQAASVVRPTS